MDIIIERTYSTLAVPNPTRRTKVGTQYAYSDDYRRKMVDLYHAYSDEYRSKAGNRYHTQHREMLYFCAMHDINLATFRTWVKRYESEAVMNALALQVSQTQKENEKLRHALRVLIQQ